MASPALAYVPIDNNPSLERHVNSMGVVSTDKQGKKKYIAQRDKILEEKKIMMDAIAEVKDLKKELDDLRLLVEMCVARTNT